MESEEQKTSGVRQVGALPGARSVLHTCPSYIRSMVPSRSKCLKVGTAQLVFA
jgi:hypothetical protein